MSIDIAVQNLIDCLPSQIAIIDEHGNILATNRSWRKFASDNGDYAEDVPDRPNYFRTCERAIATGDKLVTRVLSGMKKVVQGSEPNFRCVYPCHSKTKHRWFRMQFLPYSESGQFIITHDDITLEYLTKEQLQQLAFVDPLTKTANRRGALQQLANLAKSARRGEQWCTLMIDVDHFKSINDRFGHVTGDQVLETISGRAGACLREVDCLGRIGGEEFMVILPRTSLLRGREVAERIRTSIARDPVHAHDKAIDVTVTIGVAACNGNIDPQTVMRSADAALYDGKETGRNRVSCRRLDNTSTQCAMPTSPGDSNKFISAS